MNKEHLIEQIRQKRSFLCVGLDTDIQKIPKHLLDTEDPVFEFNKAIIDATHDLCVSYKPNTAFYECLGSRGWDSLQKTIDYLNANYPDHFTIADAKRGDIGNTSGMYARAFFDQMNFDSVTVAPYMGKDSVSPFLGREGKWVILLALTSNEGAFDFQTTYVQETETVNLAHTEGKLIDHTHEQLFMKVLRKSREWANDKNMMYVVGATKAQLLKQIRTVVPDSFLLVPGVGAQGGSLAEVVQYGKNKDIGLLVNASRSILYADSGRDFVLSARKEAQALQAEMDNLMG